MEETVTIELPLHLLVQIAVEKSFNCPKLYQLKVEKMLRDKGYSKVVDEHRDAYIKDLRDKICNSLGPESMTVLDTVLEEAKDMVKNSSIANKGKVN